MATTRPKTWEVVYRRSQTSQDLVREPKESKNTVYRPPHGQASRDGQKSGPSTDVKSTMVSFDGLPSDHSRLTSKNAPTYHEPSKEPAATRRPPQGPSFTPISRRPASTIRPNNLYQRPTSTKFGSGRVSNADDWQTRDSLTVKLRGLPSNASTLALWNAFQQEGSLDVIEIFEDRSGRRDGGAKLVFRPPPQKPFWLTGTYRVKNVSGWGNVTLEVALDERNYVSYVPSPVNPNIKLPKYTVLHPVSINFGFMRDPFTMTTMHTICAHEIAPISFALDLIRKHIDIMFRLRIRDPRGGGGSATKTPLVLQGQSDAVGSLNRDETYRFRIPIEQLQKISEVQDTDMKHSIIISLDTPPNFYRKAVGSQLDGSHDTKALYWTEWYTWFRQTDIVYDPRELKSAALALRKAQPVIDIGRWTTYRFNFESSKEDLITYRRVLYALRDYNVPAEGVDGFKVIATREPAVWEWIDRPVHIGNSSQSFLAEIQENSISLLTFPVRYQLEVCISQGRLNEHNLNKAFIDRLCELDEKRALSILKYAAKQKERTYDPMTLFSLSFGAARASEPKIPHYCAYSRKANVTPSTIYFTTPMVEISNRVVRQYIEHSDRFLRVQFTDERFQGRINSTDLKTNDEIFTRIRRALINGITIGDRHYEFLAFGNSQFREHGAYFFASTPHLGTQDIRRWMGEFHHIRTVALYAARIGQCFSTTRAINGTRVQVREMPDVEVNGFTFTDGVGKISESLAKVVAGELRLPFVPSVLQFRLGGCKGILAVWPDAQMWELHIRPSQYKFAAVHNGLEVIRWSQFAAATLNRQLIVVLSTLGVDDGVFIKKLQDMLAHLQRAMVDQAVALEMLQKHIDPNQMTMTLAGMVLEGFMKVEEPFMMSLLHLWRAWTIKSLKERARIVIDQGAFVLGCTDETRTLKGQFNSPEPIRNRSLRESADLLPEIFLQVQAGGQTWPYRVVEGFCLLARNPSLHPGDIRVVRAVDNSRLHHIRDAVVLPQTGDRDVASMCSGGDLDGDDYLVMWDNDLIPPVWNHAPMDYSVPARPTLARPVQMEDITDFFVQFIKNDRLPAIANAHMGNADLMDKGAKDDRCLRLAALHSKAVDYVKSGDPAIMPKELSPRQWPHFMEKKHLSKDRIYTSKKVLGRLYDLVERVNFVPHYKLKFDSRILNAYALKAEVLERAAEMKKGYDADMRRIMAQHTISSEFEVWSTFVMDHVSTVNRYSFHEELGGIASSLKEKYRNGVIEAAGSREFDALGPFVAAMYIVTQQEVAAALEETRQTVIVDGKEVPKRRLSVDSMPLISYPWCFVELLGKIANNNSKATEASLVEEHVSATFKTEDKQKVGQKSRGQSSVSTKEDIIETAEGITFRGEVLQLFQHGNGEGKDSPRGDNLEKNQGDGYKGEDEEEDGEGLIDLNSPKQNECTWKSTGVSGVDFMLEKSLLDTPVQAASAQITSLTPTPCRTAPKSDKTLNYVPAVSSPETEIFVDANSRIEGEVGAGVTERDEEREGQEEDGGGSAEEEEVGIDEIEETPFEALEKLLE